MNLKNICKIMKKYLLDTHTLELSNLPFHHKDPFDRLLIAIASTENYTVITKDYFFSKYDIDILW